MSRASNSGAQEVCPVCDVGLLEYAPWEYKGVGLLGMYCDYCGATPITSEQIKENHKRLKEGVK